VFEQTGAGGRPTSEPNFEVRTETVEDRCVRIVVAGDVDFVTSGLLLISLVDALARDGLARMHVDLSLVRLLDASGVGALMAAHNQAGSRGVVFRASGAVGLPRHVLEILGLLHVLGDKT
jgi:anti-anti-sigma factor